MNRLLAAVDDVLRKEQAGYRQGQGCTEHIFTLRNIIEQCTEWQRGLYIGFFDLQKTACVEIACGAYCACMAFPHIL